ncbi:probable asparagine synthetase [glutamine-hydrolyzing] [Sitodiplosis mosellana]|uniref:probable asparagine synthetase [glutamine-hydrolyzing] n=1 Tax=Sitodiplosis mosellana TaxID=263140 RepID=UPI0024438737|nr:probable asparagine synthetase [glutamine-hydrolyzing] [Sitodiplosis mosellana]
MCGILIVISPVGEIKISPKFGKRIRSIREMAYKQSKKQRHRGPDHTGVVAIPEDDVIFVQERLAVLLPETGDQPLKSQDGSIILAANGEIYNYLELSAEIAKQMGKYEPRSDCDVIIAMYEQFGSELVQHITGMFSFALYDKNAKRLLVSRDPIGIIPLYKGVDDMGNLWFSSEMKCLADICDTVEDFEPGTLLTVEKGTVTQTKYYQPTWISEIPTSKADLTLLQQKLVSAVRSHLQSDAPFGSLLSGGVDSSLIASIATQILRERDPNYRLKTYSVGLENAPDFKYSRIVADYINSDHREIIFKIEDGIDCIRETIYHTESYDITTVRCSIPMILMARFIKSEGLKMILSGEGADEIFGGYLYFHQAPNAQEFHHELVNRVLSLHKFDCLRANKATMSYGLELRVPFLDTGFLDHAMNIRPEDKMGGVKNQFAQENGRRVARIEKHILRAAFANDFLPDQVLWRQKEQFSDGVGYSWIDSIRSYAENSVDDAEFARAQEIYPINTPATKEAFYYRALFEEIFPGKSFAQTVTKWVPRLDWGCSQDPSGRAQTAHTAAYKDK